MDIRNIKEIVPSLEVGTYLQAMYSLSLEQLDGYPGIWGAMSDLSRSFQPWEENFSKGLYLAGVECIDTAEAPDGWTKWLVPGYEYIVVENRKGAFEKTLGQMKEEGVSLAGAIHDYTDPATGKGYLYFPIRKMDVNNKKFTNH